LILGEGLHAVRALHERHPTHPVIADLKTMDAGYLEAEMMYEAGATFVVVMGQAHEHTIREAVRAARAFGRHVMGDLMLCPDKVGMARKMEAMATVVVITASAGKRRLTRRV
jgi:3-hexulose-6-phosphate synthase/6-phospho-3-hexuloisomerase